MARTLFSIEFPSTFDAMGEVLEDSLATLRREGYVSGNREPEVRLCLEEALVNAIRHGNRLDADRKVRLELHEQPDGCCTIRIHDEGKGFSPDDVAAPKTEQHGGRGICLIRHFMDCVGFNRHDHCFEMALRRQRANPEAQAKSLEV